MSAAQAPHDAFVKAYFQNLDALRGELARVLAPELLAALDLDHVEQVTAEFIDERLRRKQADLVFRAPLRAGGEVFVYFLVEHQSRVDRLMPFRVLVYVTAIWTTWLERYEAEHGRPPDHLPAVLPLVIYHGDRPWPADRRALCDLVDLPAPLHPAVARWLPSLTLLLDDLGALDDAALEAPEAAALTALGLLALKHGPRPDLERRLLRCHRHLRHAASTPAGRSALEALFEYLLRVNDTVERTRLAREIRRVAGPEAQEVAMTAAQRLIAEGREEGREEGRAEGQRLTLERLLRLKFGPLPDDAERRLATADAAALARYTERVLTADTLAAVFDDP